MNEDERGRGRRTPSREQIVGGLFAGHDKAMGMVGDLMLKDAPKLTRIGLQQIPGAPGLIYDVATIASAKDKRRALIETGSGAVLGIVGGFAGGPLGAAAGSIAREKAAQLYLDHEDDIHAWMTERQAQLAKELQRYTTPPALRQPY